ncbi:MAG: ROK family protein, partial [Bacteroidetes bacterium]
QAYEAGDPFAAYVWLNSLQKLAVGLCSIINAVSPELIILGGGMAKAGDSLFGPLAKFMEIYEWRPGGEATPIRQAQLADYAGAIGAASYALNESFTHS